MHFENIFVIYFIKIWQGVYFTGTLLCQCVQKFGGRGWRSYQSSRGTASGIRLVGVTEGIIISLVGVAGGATKAAVAQHQVLD